ncbi:MAG: hypothetical protein IJ260_01340, partial [Butyrivibrio sp.]|nr:hypothetical protein [Butyrivibrio sp.]
MSYEGDLDSLSKYDIVVIDAQYFEATDIAEFRSEGHKVYSYINVGSLENFRDYYAEYQDLTLDVYENFTNTIALLKKYEIFRSNEIETDKVRFIKVVNYYPGFDTEVTPA